MVRFIALSGFLGAGKTTTLLSAARAARGRGVRVVVVTNDQGEHLIDTASARAAVAGVGEVTGGCFCCRFDDLAETTSRLIARYEADLVLAEAVGSCTDLVATVLRPLARKFGDVFAPGPLTTVVDPLRFLGFERAAARGEPETDVAYLFRAQLRDADLIAVNKVDLLPATVRHDLIETLRARYPTTEVLGYSALQEKEIEELMTRWDDQHEATAEDLDLDYDRYAAAEARLAWLNQTAELSCVEPADPREWVRTVLARMSELAGGRLIGHVKVSLTAPGGTTRGSLCRSREPGTIDEPGPDRLTTASITLNARVDCSPAELERIAALAVSSANRAVGSATTPLLGTAFSPARPAPTYRLPADVRA